MEPNSPPSRISGGHSGPGDSSTQHPETQAHPPSKYTSDNWRGPRRRWGGKAPAPHIGCGTGDNLFNPKKKANSNLEDAMESPETNALTMLPQALVGRPLTCCFALSWTTRRQRPDGHHEQPKGRRNHTSTKTILGGEEDLRLAMWPELLRHI